MAITKIDLRTDDNAVYSENTLTYTMVEAIAKLTQKLNEGIDNLNANDLTETRKLLDEATAIIDDVVTYGSNAEVVEARDGKPTLLEKLNNMVEVLTDKVNKSMNVVNYNYSIDVDVNQAFAINNPVRLKLPTYCEGPDGEVVHPHVLFFPKKWNGYHYWMAMTPYPNTVSSFENPSILVSNDRLNWTEPNGIINPVVPESSVGFNADPCLFMDPTHTTMYMVYKYAETQKHLSICHSTDGVNWTTPINVITSVNEYVSPAVVYDNNKYTMWYVENPSTNLYFRTADNPYGPWSDPLTCTISSLPTGTEDTLWHMDILKYQGQYHMLALISPSAGTGGNLYFAKSNNRLHWEMSKEPVLTRLQSRPVWDEPYLYKSAMFPIFDNDGFRYGVIYGSISPFYCGYTELRFDKSKKNLEHTNEVANAVNNIYPWVFGDNFNRADTTAGLGVSDSGHTWVAVGGQLGIQNKKAYAITPGYSTIDVGKTDFYASFRLSNFTLTSECLFNFRRGVDGRWRFGLSSNVYLLSKTYNGVTSEPIQAMKNPKVGDWIAVECKDGIIKCYVNGVLSASIDDSNLKFNTEMALAISSTDVRVEDLVIRDVI